MDKLTNVVAQAMTKCQDTLCQFCKYRDVPTMIGCKSAFIADHIVQSGILTKRRTVNLNVKVKRKGD